MTARVIANLSPDILRQAAEMRAIGGDHVHKHGKLGWRKIAIALKVSERALMAHLDPGQLQRRRRTNLLSFQRVTRRVGPTERTIGLAVGIKVEIPAHVLEERDRRLSLVVDPIAQLLGDPPRGYSALDRKRAQANV